MTEEQQKVLVFLLLGYINLHLLFEEDEEEDVEDDTN